MASSTTPPGHLIGLPVNASTYRNHGCECAGCLADNALRHRLARARPDGKIIDQVNRRARGEAVKWVRDHHPEVWAQLREAAWIEYGGRRPRRRRGAES